MFEFEDKDHQDSSKEVLMSFKVSVTRLWFPNMARSVKAYADVRLISDAGSIKISGLSIVAKQGRPLWVALPQRPGRYGGRYFPVVEAEGKLRDLIENEVLKTYRGSKKRISEAVRRPGKSGSRSEISNRNEKEVCQQ